MASGPCDPRLTRRDLIKSTGLAGTAIIWPDAADATAMRAGKHAGTEVPAATSLEECWALVDTSEQTRRHWQAPRSRP